MFFSKASQNDLQDILPDKGEGLTPFELQELSLALTTLAGCSLSMRVREKSVGRELPSSRAINQESKIPGVQQALPGFEVDEQGQDAPQDVVDRPSL